MGRRRKQSEHSSEEIKEMALTAARRLIAKQGYGALSTRKVADAIGYAVGSLYLVFRNLDDLIVHINGSTLDDLHTTLEAVTVRGKDPERCLLALARQYINFGFANRALWSLIFEHPPATPLPSWFQEKVTRMFEIVEQQLRDVAPERSAKDLKTAAQALWSGVHGVAVLGLADRLHEQGLEAADKIVTSLVTNYLIGFKQKPKRR
ncbi:MAG: TetR/AcrR family transcriptional regulator [Gammaproteobacteria bacterium]|nr:TetR/AcrR family transcriptional regulator [Gammaproteobacteria bacterium]